MKVNKTMMGNLIKDVITIIIIIAAVFALRHAHAPDHDRGEERDAEKMMQTLDEGEEERGATRQPQQHNNKKKTLIEDVHHFLLGIKPKEPILRNDEQHRRTTDLVLDHIEEKERIPLSCQMRMRTLDKFGEEREVIPR